MEGREYDARIAQEASRMWIDAYKDEHGTYLFIRNEKMENWHVVEKTVPEGFVNLAGRYITHAELAENHAMAVRMSKAGHIANILAWKYARYRAKRSEGLQHDINDSSKWIQWTLLD